MWRAIQNSLRQFANFRIDHRLAAANRDDRGPALIRSFKAFLNSQDFIDRRLIFANPAAARARQIAGMQRLEHHHHRKFLRATKSLPGDVPRDFRGHA